MSQVNKYTDRAAYASDTDRLSTQSAVSLIASDNEIIYDGVNVVVGKDAASVGDCAVYDKTAGAIRFVKGETLSAAQLPATLTPLAVVYARQGDKVLIVALDNATESAQRWAYTYEVALSGFDLVTGGTIVLRIGSETEVSITYAAGGTLADLVSATNTAFRTTLALGSPLTSVDRGGWAAVADDASGRMIITANGYMPGWTTIAVISGATMTTRPENVNYQTILTGILIEGSNEYVRRENGVDTTNAGCNFEAALQFYSVEGTTPTSNVPLGSIAIVNKTSFENSEFCAELRAAYPDYSAYIQGEAMAEYPSVYGAMLRDGRTNTAKIGRLRFTDIYGLSKPCYPAAAAALEYGVTVEGATTGLEAGAWWLPSIDEIYLLMKDRVLTSADVEADPVNGTLVRLGKTTCYGKNYHQYTSCESSSRYVYFYSGQVGYVGVDSKLNAMHVRPVSAL